MILLYVFPDTILFSLLPCFSVHCPFSPLISWQTQHGWLTESKFKLFWKIIFKHGGLTALRGEVLLTSFFFQGVLTYWWLPETGNPDVQTDDKGVTTEHVIMPTGESPLGSTVGSSIDASSASPSSPPFPPQWWRTGGKTQRTSEEKKLGQNRKRQLWETHGEI